MKTNEYGLTFLLTHTFSFYFGGGEFFPGKELHALVLRTKLTVNQQIIHWNRK